MSRSSDCCAIYTLCTRISAFYLRIIINNNSSGIKNIQYILCANPLHNNDHLVYLLTLRRYTILFSVASHTISHCVDGRPSSFHCKLMVPMCTFFLSLSHQYIDCSYFTWDELAKNEHKYPIDMPMLMPISNEIHIINFPIKCMYQWCCCGSNFVVAMLGLLVVWLLLLPLLPH